MRARCYCTNEACERSKRPFMRNVGTALHLPCSECGATCEPTRRLPGGEPSGRTHVMMVRVHPLTFARLGSQGKPPATVAGETLDKIFGMSLDNPPDSP